MQERRQPPRRQAPYGQSPRRQQTPVRTKRPVRRKKRLSQKQLLILTAVAVVVLAFVIPNLIRLFTVGVGNSTYYNVEVNGVNLKGYTRQEAQKLFDDLVGDWNSREYKLSFGDSTWDFTAESFGAQLETDNVLNWAWNLGHVGSLKQRSADVKKMKKTPQTFLTELTMDDGMLKKYVDAIGDAIDREPVEAEVVMDVNAPVIVTESEIGYKLDREKTREQIRNMLLTGETEQALNVEVLEPAVSSDEVSGQLEIIASYVTSLHGSNANRISNVKLALSRFDVMAVYDGQTVSFNDVVGERSKERGFKEAPEYSGATVVTGYGGGCCQVSTTLYCAVVKAGCDIIERHPHNMTVGYAKPSMDATVSWKSKDFVFQNNTGHTLYIYTRVIDKKAIVAIYGSRPEYKIDFQSEIVKKKVEATREEVREDATGQYAYYTDEKVLVSQGKDGCISQGWLVYYDWDTEEEVKRVQVSQDTYSAGTSVYYVGVHNRGTDMPAN